MSLSTLLTLIRRQLLAKWGRTLISALGIAVGVWAILLVVALSQGLSDKLVRAVNSQTVARSIQFYGTSNGATSFFDPDITTSEFLALPYDTLETQVTDLADQNIVVTSAEVSDTMNVYLSDPAQTELRCVNTDIEYALATETVSTDVLDQSLTDPSVLSAEARALRTTLDQCRELRLILQPFEFFVELAADEDWYGSRDLPVGNEIMTCYVCDADSPLHEALGVDDPADMVGQSVTLEYKSLPATDLAGDTFSITDPGAFLRADSLKQSVPREYTVTGVYDDRSDSTGLQAEFLGGTGYVARSQYLEAITQQESNFPVAELGYQEFNILLDSFGDLDEAVDLLRASDLLVISIGQLLSSTIETAFTVLTIILGFFALVALVAAIFGIVNVMTISVLERRKEIGILKSLGSRGTDMFWMFLLESVFLGLLGWLLGVLVTWLSTLAVTAGIEFALDLNPDVVESLEQLNLTDFSIPLPLWSLAATLALAVVFTVLSGLFPALSASRQNPTEVLREE